MLKKLFAKIAAGRLQKPAEGNSLVAIRENDAAEACARIGRWGLAERHLEIAIQNDPESAALQHNLGLLRHSVGDIDGAEECYMRALRLEPDRQETHSSLLSICDFSADLRGSEGFARHRRWAETYADPLTTLVRGHANDPDSERRLRVGYVSADLRDHVIGRFIEPVLLCHDRRGVDVFIYSASVLEDARTKRLKELVPNWRNITDLSDDQATLLIRNDSIDLLVDLSGHSAGNRLLMFARKPAPVQLTWMGYLNTTGMIAMDYKVTDAVADPIGVDAYYREKLLRLPSSQWCYSQSVRRPKVSDSQNRSNASRILLGCVARFMKISDECVDLWIDLLLAVENADLRLVDVPDHPHADSILARFSHAGLANRVSVLPTLHGDEYWKCIMELDLALDPFPYTGATTSLDCLWMGVPVITRVGAYGSERSAASILSGVGCQRLIAQSNDEYVQLVRAMDSDRLQLAEISSQLSRMIGESPLCDSGRFTVDWESSLRSVWSHWCMDRIGKSR